MTDIDFETLALFRKPAHSDFLIHWTGDDIDKKYDKKWLKSKSTTLNKKIIAPYLERLKYILRCGLWMIQDQDPLYLRSRDDKRDKRFTRPLVWRTSFTELKLSDAHLHAAHFGRLGIGVKRPFVFERMGLPVMYHHKDWMNWLASDGTSYRTRSFKQLWSCYLKLMDEKGARPGQYIKYSQYDESEWRIIYSKDIEKKLAARKATARNVRFFREPSSISDPEFQSYVSKQSKKPGYLLPLGENDGQSRWLAIIIYPSLAVKVAAEASKEIRTVIENLKPYCSEARATTLTESAPYELYSKPMEIDLDACRNF